MEQQETSSSSSNAERLLRAQALELSALRERVAGMPDPDVLAAWRASHERLSELQADLPAWRQQLQAAHQQERQQLQQRLQEQEQALSAAQLRSELQTAFLQAGGNPAHFGAWLELYGSKYARRGDDGALAVSENGEPIALADALANQREDALYGAFFHPQFGSGSGARPGRDIRVTNGPDLQKMKTGDLFRTAFSNGRS